jgi:Domain of unknown function (DUF4105)
LSVFYFFFLISVVRGQSAANQNNAGFLGLPRLTNAAVVSLVTYSPGEELYTAFGHSCIRIEDDGLGLDRLYNFGTFDFNTPYFYLKFARGDLLYELAVGQANAEINRVGAVGQGVTEVMLDLTETQKQQLFRDLEVNLLPENRAYHYGFIFDNCSTRIRDVFERIIGKQLSAPIKRPRTFREMLDPYFERIPWIQFGIYLLLGAKVDRVATGREACFLPADLDSATESASIHRTSLEARKIRVFEPRELPQPSSLINPQYVFGLTGIVWFLLWYFQKRGHSPRLSGFYLAIIGLTGTFIFVFSLVTQHWEAHESLNLIWLFPGHLLAGLWLLTDPDSPSPILRSYLAIACFGSALFGVVAHWLPQKFHPSIYPLIALLIWRCALERERTGVASKLKPISGRCHSPPDGSAS